MAPISDLSLNPTIAHSSIPMHEVILDHGDASDETCRPPENREISVHYAVLDEVWNKNEMIVNDTFTYLVATNIMLSDDIEPRSVFGPIVPTPPCVKPVGYKWIFVRKRNEKNEIVQYKARLIVQGFFQCPEIDYEETYFPLMDVVTAYLYRDLDTEIYLKVPEGLPLTGSNSSRPWNILSIRLRRSP
ncbi:hypothetical protein ACFX1T_024563 [Malus domestica]